jgi:hypothetical protein
LIRTGGRDTRSAGGRLGIGRSASGNDMRFFDFRLETSRLGERTNTDGDDDRIINSFYKFDGTKVIILNK